MASRHRRNTASRHRALALDRGPYPAHATPSRAIRAYTAATNEDISSTQTEALVLFDPATGCYHFFTLTSDGAMAPSPSRRNRPNSVRKQRCHDDLHVSRHRAGPHHPCLSGFSWFAHRDYRMLMFLPALMRSARPPKLNSCSLTSFILVREFINL